MTQTTSVLVCGYDEYASLWPTFKHSFDKYWDDCPWTVYFITNHFNGPPGFQTIHTGKEINWADKVLTALSRVDSEIIFWMMEDFWLTGPVQTLLLKRYSKLMQKNKNIAQIRLLCPFDKEGRIIPEKELIDQTPFEGTLWYFKIDAEYRATVSATMWRKEKLLKYLRDGMNPWLFEQQASVLSGQAPEELYLCTINPFTFPLCHLTNPYSKVECRDDVVTKGKWRKAAYEYTRKEGLLVNFRYHPDGTFNNEWEEWSTVSKPPSKII